MPYGLSKRTPTKAVASYAKPGTASHKPSARKAMPVKKSMAPRTRGR